MQESLYQARILDHTQHPRNKREMADATVAVRAMNPLCGDALVLYIRTEDATIQDVSFFGTGCAISQAAASLLTEKLQGVPLKHARAFTEADMYTLLGIEVSTGRRKCALLAWHALRDALVCL